MAKVTPGSPEHRARIIRNMRRQRADILQYFADLEHWNAKRAHGEEPIDPDPGGKLRQILEGLEFALAAEAAAGGVGPIEPIAGVSTDKRRPQ